MRGVFVTGTDTGVGKTVVSCALAAAFRARGRRVGVYKPVETGCRRDRGRLLGEDAGRLRAAAGDCQPLESVTGALFELPAAPWVAATAEGLSVDPASLVHEARGILAAHDFTVIEGAGGLLVPIAPSFTYRELARELALPVVVVVGSRLGCINHALLTLETIKRAGLDCAGFVMNRIEGEADPGVESNLEAIRSFSDASCLGVFPTVEAERRGDYRHLAELAERSLDLARLGA